MKHRLLSILLALVLVFTLFPIDSYAAKGNGNGKYQAGKKELCLTVSAGKFILTSGKAGCEVYMEK